MIIENFRSECLHSRARVTATVRWEDSDRPTQEIYFETQEEFAEDLTPNPHAFLVGCLIPAFHYGEKRITIEGEICPELRDGLMAAIDLLRHWYYEPGHSLPRIEAKRLTKLLTPGKSRRAGAFFSGGIDAHTMIINNHLHLTPEHSGYIKDGLIVFGLHREEPENFSNVLIRMMDVARMAGLIPIPVWTNIVSLGDGWEYWGDESEGAILAAIGHSLSKRLSVVSIASSFDIPHLHPHGSHPLIDPSYSSRDLRIKHDGICLSRLMKVKIVAGWDVGLQNLRVCNITKSSSLEKLNCGQCEKCVRTMLALLAVGALDRTRVFSRQDVSPDLIESVVYIDITTAPFYGELLAPLTALGRQDLVVAIKIKLSRFASLELRQQLRKRFRQYDNEFMYGAVAKIKKVLFPGKAAT